MRSLPQPLGPRGALLLPHMVRQTGLPSRDEDNLSRADRRRGITSSLSSQKRDRGGFGIGSSSAIQASAHLRHCPRRRRDDQRRAVLQPLRAHARAKAVTRRPPPTLLGCASPLDGCFGGRANGRWSVDPTPRGEVAARPVPCQSRPSCRISAAAWPRCSG